MKINEKKFQCNQCIVSHATSQGLSLHKALEHKENIESLMCSNCNKGFNRKGNFQHHIQKCKSPKKNVEFKCNTCKQIFASKFSLNWHQKDSCKRKEKGKRKVKKFLPSMIPSDR